jgi:hypothetical protein
MKKNLAALGKLINAIVKSSLLASAILPVQNAQASQTQTHIHLTYGNIHRPLIFHNKDK